MLIAGLSFFFGLAIGSFLNVLIYRLPKKKAPVGRSACPNCHHLLSPLDLVPLFSFLSLRGRCRYCKTKLSLMYPAVEAVTALLFVLSALIFPPTSLLTTLIFVKALFFVSVAVLVFAIDARHFKIFTAVVYPAAIILTFLNVLIDTIGKTFSFSLSSYTISGLVAGFIGFILFYTIWKISNHKWVGDGDFRLMWFLGTGLGLTSFIAGLYLGIILGGVCAVALLLSGSAKLKDKLPFAIFLIPGALVALFWGPVLSKLYLSLVGWG